MEQETAYTGSEQDYMSWTNDKPTTETYNCLQQAYNHFNEDLFQDKLPDCLITFQRKKNCYGYFHGNVWESESNRADEIALNPDHLKGRPDIATLATLVHEMVHLKQHHFGKPSRSGYHNKEWAEYMEKVGLMPTSTGKEGGKKTGQKVTHYVIECGYFQESAEKLFAAGYSIPWKFVAPSNDKKKKKENNKVKYSCPSCDLNLWGKPDANVICGDCSEPMESMS